LDPISFGRLWPVTVAAVRRHTDLLWPLAAAFLFLPQLLLARHVADRKPDQLFVGEAFAGDAVAVGLLLLVTTLGQLVMARIVAHDGTEGRTLGAELRTAVARLPAAMAVFAAMLVLFLIASFLPATLLTLMGGGTALAVAAVLVAGLWLWARLGIVLPLVATDHPEPVWAIGSAWRLTRGRALRILGMLAVLVLGFLLLAAGIGGIGAAAGFVTTLATGKAADGWGVGRWLFELINAAASAAVGTFYIAFLTLLTQALKRENPAAG
jgi:hypothetical protein